jgi:RNA polymerase primary sigma factor
MSSEFSDQYNYSPQSGETPWLDKWNREEAELKTMLSVDTLLPQFISSPEWEHYSTLVASGDFEAEQELVSRRLRIAYGTAKKFDKGLDSNELTVEDHFQHAMEGVLYGISRWRTDQKRFLEKTISYGIWRGLGKGARKRGLIVNAYFYEKSQRIEAAWSEITKQHGKASEAKVDIDELVAATGLEKDEVELLKAARQTFTYEHLQPLPDAEESEERMIDTNSRDLDVALLVKEALVNLPQRERKVLELRYGLGDERSHTFKEIGALLGYSKQLMHRVEGETLKNLQDLFGIR